MNRRLPGLTLCLVSVAVAGCTLNEVLPESRKIEYKSAGKVPTLEVPPDLSQLNRDDRYLVPDDGGKGSATFSAYSAERRPEAQAGQSVVLPQVDKVRVERSGSQRWLVVATPADKLWDPVKEFWQETGFIVNVERPEAGVMETDWAENRAKIPESWLRQALGSVLEQAWDSGEREKFRTRVERVNGHTEIYVSHRQMLEKRVGSDGSQVQWQNGKEDPGLNAAMLARMLVFLGTDVDNARKLVQQAEAAPQKPAVQQDVRAQGAQLVVDESFDRAWRRVGVALDSGGFAVEDRDRSAGDYFVRYVDTDTGEKNEQPGFFSRMFSGDKKAQAPQYRIHVAGSGNQTNVTVLDANGQRDSSATAQRLLSVLKDKM